jgi:hypothetical protein
MLNVLISRDIDLKKYGNEPQDLTRYMTICTDNYSCSYGGFSNVWKYKLESFSQNGVKVRLSIGLLSKD